MAASPLLAVLPLGSCSRWRGLATALSIPPAATAADPRPFPALEVGMPIGPITRIAVDRPGRWAVTAAVGSSAFLTCPMWCSTWPSPPLAAASPLDPLDP